MIMAVEDFGLGIGSLDEIRVCVEGLVDMYGSGLECESV